jgi:hypothetical protein
MEKQVRYFEAIYKGNLEQHYVQDTEHFEGYKAIFEHFDTNSKITYIAYDDGTTEGEAVDYKIL